jgi:xanthine dehydrogenase accessory factor
MDIYREMAEKKESGQVFVLATIVAITGSSPRDVGAKMLVFPDGSISGTIGGGKFEKTVIEDSLELLKGDLLHILKKYRFTENGPEATGMYCGGEAEVFLEVSAQPKRLVVFGGGHVGREIAKLAAGLSFRITIVDDRQEILDDYRPPVETILTDPDFNDNFPSLDENCFVVIVTHGHAGDQSVLAKVLKEKCAYVGMIGSKAKIAKIYSSLQESGMDKALFDRVQAPIGLHIGAEGPYEIAVSIIAEIIAEKSKISGRLK